MVKKEKKKRGLEFHSVTEYMLSMHKALVSIPSTKKRGSRCRFIHMDIYSQILVFKTHH